MPAVLEWSVSVKNAITPLGVVSSEPVNKKGKLFIDQNKYNFINYLFYN